MLLLNQELFNSQVTLNSDYYLYESLSPPAG